jgi:hypothetical protein
MVDRRRDLFETKEKSKDLIEIETLGSMLKKNMLFGFVQSRTILICNYLKKTLAISIIRGC